MDLSVQKKRLQFSIFAAVIAEIANKIFPIIVISYAQRQLGLAAFGYAQFGMYFIDLLIPLVVWGYGTQGTIEVGASKDSPTLIKELMSSILVIKIIHALAAIIIIISICYFVPSYQKYLTIIFCLSFIYITSAFDMAFVIHGTQKTYLMSIFSVVSKVIALVLIITLVKSPDDAILYAVISFGANGIISALTAIYSIKTFGLTLGIKLSFLKKNIKKAIPLGISSILLFLTDSIDMFWVERLFSQETLGGYAAIMRLYKALIPILYLVAGVFFSEMVGAISSEKRETLVRYVFWVLLSVSVPVSFGVYFVSGDLLNLIFGAELVPYGDSLAIMFLGMILYSFILVFGTQVLVLNYMVNRFNLILVLGLIGSCILMFFWGSAYQVKGVLCAALVTKSIVVVFVCISAKQFIGKFPFRDIFNVLIPGFFMVATLMLINIDHFLLRILLGAFSFLLLYIPMNYKMIQTALSTASRKA